MHLTGQSYNKRYSDIRAVVERYLRGIFRTKAPESVYTPIRYVMAGGGKRLRAVLALVSCEAVGGTASSALPVAAAVEMLHNFTLVHDDIMDHADLRRGRPTVHRRWNTSVAILSGDQLVALAYETLLRTKTDRLPQLISLFTRAFIDVCDGQGFDYEFESRTDVTMQEYLKMITLKTGKVIAAAAEMGGLVGGGTTAEIGSLRRYGGHLGRAFQIRDDLLDIVGDQHEFGKTIGGDIREGKKTFLLLEAFSRSTGADRVLLRRVIRRRGITKRTVDHVRVLYRRLDVIESAEEAILQSTRLAQKSLNALPASPSRDVLVQLSEQLLARKA